MTRANTSETRNTQLPVRDRNTQVMAAQYMYGYDRNTPAKSNTAYDQAYD